MTDSDVKKYYDALQLLKKLMDDDGTAVTMGLNNYLKSKGCKYTQEVSKWLYAEGYVKNSGTNRRPVIFWNSKAIPSMEFVTWMLDLIAQKRSGKPTAIKKVEETIHKTSNDNSLLDKLDFAQKMGLQDININKLINYIQNENN